MESSKSFKKILLIFALEKEATPLVSLLSLPQDQSLLTNPVVSAYSGIYKSLTISIIYPKIDPKFNCDSIGPENAAVATYVGIKAYQPDLIISAGTSGAFQTSEGKEIPFKIGDVCYSKEPIGFIDREIVLESFKDYMVGKYEIVQMKEILDGLGFKEALIGTTSSFHDFCSKYSYEKGIEIQEMEAAAIQKISCLMNIPFFAVKVVVSLNYGKDMPEEITKKFYENYADKSEKFAVELRKMLDALSS